MNKSFHGALYQHFTLNIWDQYINMARRRVSNSTLKFLNRLLLLFATAVIFIPEASTSKARLPHVRDGKLNVTYNGIVNHDLQWAYLYQVDPLYEKYLTTTLRLKVGIKGIPEDAVFITILQPNAESSSLRLQPLVGPRGQGSTEDMYFVERTICILNAKPEDPLPISVTLSTQSEDDVPYTLAISIYQDFLIELGISKNLVISQNTPYYFRFQFEESTSSVRILADSSSNNQMCMTFSVQALSCPVFDQPESVHYQGIYQTISSSGALIVKKQKPLKEGFVVVLVVHPNNQECMRRDPFSLPFPSVVSSSSSSAGEKPTTNSNSFSVTLRAVADSKIHLDDISKMLCWGIPILIVFGVVLATFIVLKIRHALIRHYSEAAQRARRPTGRGICKSIKRKLLATKFIENLHVSKFTTGSKFLNLVNIVGLFYVTPVCQFAVYYFRVQISTGDLDLCYYNYRCAQPIGLFLDFNHLVSNLPYMIFGLLFYFISLNQIELQLLNQQGQVQEKHDEGLGIPPNFGMFKALGIALILEGVLSASYHLCPNEATFQFDTCFMYVIAVLTTVLIYQQRHPRSFNSNHTFGALGCILLLTFMGLLTEVTSLDKTVLGACFWFIQLGVTLLVCFNYCFIGVLAELRGPANIIRHIFKRNTWRKEHFLSHRLLFPFVSIVLTLMLGVLWLVFKWNISAYLLNLLITKLVWNLAHYFIMKIVHGEFTRTSWFFPTFYFFLSGAFAVFAMKYYVDVAAKWELTPSESRAVNHECLNLFGIEAYPYDSHDVWHFLSAACIFLAFNGLLILDDDLIVTPRADIAVF
ncbi:SID1 transmembrane family member 1 [Orchesella cincta]|uniref:SID1 transmembrane family member 1 n=1 Tax=Orchesella cincta TaxID=48709 RepID=A0A1D2M3G6_ORCCI|nr:SID1 transmembrane family member 1 [Orchesella cincta]